MMEFLKKYGPIALAVIVSWVVVMDFIVPTVLETACGLGMDGACRKLERMAAVEQRFSLSADGRQVHFAPMTTVGNVGGSPRSMQQVRQQIPSQPTCLPGYQWYPDKRQCVQVYDQPQLVQANANCRPGETKWVDDPAHPGHRKQLTCGF